MMPHAPSFLVCIKSILLPFVMWAALPLPFLRLSLLIQGSQTTMEAVLPCPLAAGLGNPQ